MNRVTSRKLQFFDKFVTDLIIQKYGFNEMQAIREFIQSETYQMLNDPELALYQVSPHIIFDLWENEKITGEPRNSLYIRGDY